MFTAVGVFGVMLLYIGVLFGIAVWGERHSKAAVTLGNSRWVYALSLAVYCTSWTFYGSVGKAATGGASFLTIYFGPTLAFLFAWSFLRRLVRAKNTHRITSIADFISSRYNKSEGLAALVTIVALIGTVPYVSLQLKAILNTFHIFAQEQGVQGTFSEIISTHTGPLVTLLMVLFTIVFGVRRLDPTERHPGMMLALTTECIVKLLAFLVAGAYVTYGLFDGFSDIFTRYQAAKAAGTLTHTVPPPSVSSWVSLCLLSASAIFFLPRQFHAGVVECSEEKHIRTAQWVVPLYCFIINLFVIPIALAGLLLGHPATKADSFVLLLPLNAGQVGLSTFIYLGGFSAATGMVLIESMAMSTMVTNHLVLPIIEKIAALNPLRRRLLQIRWLAVGIFLGLGYFFTVTVGDSYMLVNMGLMAFAAVLQFAPGLIGGVYWRRATKAGALWGLAVGFSLWCYTLFVPAFAKSGWLLAESFIEQGPWGISFLKPYALFGLTGFDSLTHSVFWTVLFNSAAFIIGSLLSEQNDQEREAADAFVDILTSDQGKSWNISLEANIPVTEKKAILEKVFSTYLDPARAQEAIEKCFSELVLEGRETMSVLEVSQLKASADKILSGSIGGAASNKALNSSGLLTEPEKEKLSVAYSQILAELNVRPEELREKVNYYQERERLMKEHTDQLEARVQERTRELKSTQARLLDASRMAGMAEVATGVLHNVGNVLNSITVGAQLLRERTQQSKVKRLTQVVDMMDSQQETLGKYLTEDAKGKLIPGFLKELSGTLASENKEFHNGIEDISKHIEHIKSIVAEQQALARGVGGVDVECNLQELMEDAIKIGAGDTVNHGITIRRDYDSLPQVSVDKHKILQILVNLVSNARHAVKEVERVDRTIAVKVKAADQGRIQMEVSDNGIGIPEEHLTKVFSHGFTTKKEGHGFGLHSCALAAKQMGGSLGVRSNGVGHGATFTLDLPLTLRGSKEG